MFSDFAKNDLLLAMMATLTGETVGLESAEVAFKEAKGDFRAKFAAAVRARLAQSAVAEVFIELPEDPERLLKAELEKLLERAPHGFLGSFPFER